MKALTLDESRAIMLDVVMHLLYEGDECKHDEFTLCPAMLCKVIGLFNIYSEDLYKRIMTYSLPENHGSFSMREYWKDFIKHLVKEPDDIGSIDVLRKYLK